MRSRTTVATMAAMLVLPTAAMALPPDPILDLLTDALIVPYDDAGPSPYPEITLKLRSGRNGGTWDGIGIMSSQAAADRIHFGFEITAVGSAQNDLLPVPYDVFADLPVDPTTVFMWYTVVGDADLDRVVGESDRQILLQYYDGGIRDDRYWCQGDFNYDGKVDDIDANVLNRMYGTSLDSIPEPATLSLLAVGALLLIRRRAAVAYATRR